MSGNTAEKDGGGIFVCATSDPFNPYPVPQAITVAQSTVSGNTAYDRGGGIYTKSFDGTEVTVEQTSVTDNHVPVNTSGHQNGGGIYAYLWDNSGGANKPKWTITGSTVDNNDAALMGGGIFVCSKYHGNFVMTNSTVSDNETTQSNGAGGGVLIAIFVSGESIDAFLRNVTVTQNVSQMGGGIATKPFNGVHVQLDNSIVAENFITPAKSTPNNLVGWLDIANTQYNLVGSGSSISDLNGAPATLDATNITGTPPTRRI